MWLGGWISSVAILSGSTMKAILLFLVLAQLPGGCGRDPQRSPLEWKLSGAGTVQSILPSTDSVVLLVHDPADCLACGNPIGVWHGWATGSRRRGLLIVLTRTASSAEAHALAAARVKIGGYLARGYQSLVTPRGYFFVGLKVVDSAPGRVQLESFMKRVTSGKVSSPSPTT